MELRTTRQMRRNEQLSKSMAKKAESTDVPAKAQPAPRQQAAPADKVSVSAQALAFLEEQNRKVWEEAQEREQRRQNRLSDSLSSLQSAEQELESMSEKLKVQNKCQKIAASIMRGDRVPPEDLQYLMNNDPDGYKLAMAMRREKEDPEDCESVLDDEDKNGSVKESDGGGESPEVSAPEASSGGGSASAAAE